MLKLNNYFDIKWLVLAVTFTATVILLTHIPQESMPSQLQEGGLDILLHVVAYGAITFFLILSVKSSFSLGSALVVLFTLLAIAIVDEITQPLVSRQESLADLVADVIGIVAVLLPSTVGKHRFQKTKTESVSRLCLTAAVAFIAGILVVPATLISLSKLKGPSLQQDACYFFYRTMHELFEGNYNPVEGSVSKDALETFKEYGPRLGDKCYLLINDYTYNAFVGKAFFPSGDMFHVVIVRIGEHFVLKRFNPGDWELHWKELMPDSEQHSIE
ncbi:MAG: VanZ family protein [Planctomycetota bacterium]|jgi:VanZ family protein